MAIDVQNTCHTNGDVATGNLTNAGGSFNRVNGAYGVNGYGAGTAAQVDRINGNSSHDSLESSRQLPSEPIAIIGLSCRLPGQATNPEKLWELCVKGLSAWSEVPELRFNQKAFHHTDYQRMGMSNAKGAHFMSEDIGVFDASFFNLSAEIASAMDPQLRMQLESVFEATENAGLPLHVLAGTTTSVYSGSFFRDYGDGIMRDPDTIPRTALTGNGSAMMSNRVSHFFDFHGPSITVDTGCSTSLTALHLACQGLRSGEAAMSIVAAANLLLNPDNFIMLSSLGVLGDDGKCFAWDARANGYGRGEGVATLVLKPLKDAIRDGDNVRAVIRETGVNQDGKTRTITSPSTAAQEALIRSCYRRAGLDPSQTPYVEAHMTGTLTGDPIEAEAIANVFGKTRPVEQPVLVGSLKTNVGHLESTSGIASVIKVVLALENGVIPPSLNFDTPNSAIDLVGWNLEVPTTTRPWPADLPRRASINNFGYGGANAHAILDAFSPSEHEPHRTTLQHAFSKIPRVLLISGKSSGATTRTVENLAGYLRAKQEVGEHVDFDDFVHTFSTRRSIFPFKAAFQASSIPELLQLLDNYTGTPSNPRGQPRIGFVFNGQGAQWYAMGRELLHSYPMFHSAIVRAEQSLKTCGAPWSLIEELSRDEASSRVNEPWLSQCMCVALQICLVDLLASWNIKPKAVTSHSSGEIAAAYNAGILTFEEALGVVYFRGLLADKHQQETKIPGAMMAVAITPQEVEPYLSKIRQGKVVVACINSPSSVTLSGDIDGIEEARLMLSQEGIFVRRLKVKAAYHSHHMTAIADSYLKALEKIISAQRPVAGGIKYASPVTGKLITQYENVGAAYWVENLTRPVLFSQALQRMCWSATSTDSTPETSDIDLLLEIGPHGALGGPIRQILKAHPRTSTTISYASCLTRDEDAVNTMQAMASLLVCQGYPVDLNAVNFPEGEAGLRVLSDLPPYPWNHQTRYWAESRINVAHRQRKHAPHELLGSLVIGTNLLAPTWRKFLRAAELPWLSDHRLQNDMVLPAAASISMAVEAVSQMNDHTKQPIASYELRDVEFSNALLIPNTADGIEIQFALRRCNNKELDDSYWFEFTLYSVSTSDSLWKEHSHGYVLARTADITTELPTEPQDQYALPIDKTTRSQRLEPDAIFEKLRKVGVFHGRSFQNLLNIETNGHHSSTTFHINNASSGLESCTVHPITLDSIFQVGYTTVDKGLFDGFMVLPRSLSQMQISSSIIRSGGHVFSAISEMIKQDFSGFRSSIKVFNEGHERGSVQLEVKNLFCQSISQGLSQPAALETSTCFKTTWHPDWNFTSSEDLMELLKMSADPHESSLDRGLTRATFHFIHDCLSNLKDEDVSELEWQHRRLLDWMKAQIDLARQGLLGRGSEMWFKASKGLKEQLFDEVAASSVNGQMLCRIGRNLESILAKRVAPLELMMEQKLLYQFYEGALHCTRSYEQVRRLVQLYTRKVPNGKILEIGGGTGGCTSCVLQSLTGDGTNSDYNFAHYDFTDISTGFFEQTAKKFGKWRHLMSFKRLDIEQDPIEQGFEAESYDLVIAFQVLHATKDMVNTMSNVRRVMKPGSRIIMVETTRDTIDGQLIFGVLPGWWLGIEEERKMSPNLSVDAWKSIMSKAGFSGLDVEMGDCEDRELASFSTMLSTAIPAKQIYPDQVSLIRNTSRNESWLQDLAERLARLTGTHVVIEDFSSIEADGKFCIMASELEKPLIKDLDASTFAALRNILTRAKGVLWATAAGLTEGAKPEYGLLQGLLRTLRMENSSRRLVSVDFEVTGKPWTDKVSRTLATVFASAFDLNHEPDQIDNEFSVKDDQILISRIYQDETQNKMTAALGQSNLSVKPFVGSQTLLQLEVGDRGLLDSLRFCEKTTLPDLLDGYIEIEPKAFGLNFRDVLVALGQLNTDVMGYECSGLITKLGPHTAQSGLKVGDRVCALLTGHYATQVQCPWTCVGKIPDSMGFAEAASIPMVFVTAYHSLYNLARLSKGETVLIHAASGGVGQAAVMLAAHRGAEVFVTVGTQAKRVFVKQNYGIPDDHIFSSRDTSFSTEIMSKTNGRGVDVILNSLGGRLLKESFHCISTFGRFIEIGRRDMEQGKRLDMGPFCRAASFAAVDLLKLGQLKSEVIGDAMREILGLFSSRTIRAVLPIMEYPISDIPTAFRTMQTGKHMGKIVIIPNPADEVKVISRVQRAQFSSEASYLIAGGAGGIGQSLAHRMAQLGCKYIVLLSRSAASNTADGNFANSLRELGCETFIRNCDASDENSLATVLAECRQKFPPVRGIVQAAMALHDSIFERMTFEQWTDALAPKVAATWNLHNKLPSLDFFVMLSSLTGVGGSPSQANYSAGSTFQDAFAKYRGSCGLPAVSIDLGYVMGAGYVANTDGVGQRLVKIGFEPISEDQTLRIIETAMLEPMRSVEGSQVVTGVRRYDETMNVAWRHDRRFWPLQVSHGGSDGKGQAAESAGVAGSGSSGDPLHFTIAAAPNQDGVVKVVTTALVEKMSEMFSLPADGIDENQSLSYYGVDSLVAVEVRNWIMLAAKADVSIFDVVQSASVVELARKVAETIKKA